MGIVRFVNPKPATIQANPIPIKELSPKKRGSASRLSELRDSRVVNTLDKERSDSKIDA